MSNLKSSVVELMEIFENYQIIVKLDRDNALIKLYMKSIKTK